MDFVVDAMNVIGSRPDGWWRDRRGAQRRFVDEVAAYTEGGGHRAIVVIDGRPDPAMGRAAIERHQRGVALRYAPGGRDAADDAIVALVSGFADPGAVTVVTSDRGLVSRVRGLGASVMAASAFLARVGAAR